MEDSSMLSVVCRGGRRVDVGSGGVCNQIYGSCSSEMLHNPI